MKLGGIHEAQLVLRNPGLRSLLVKHNSAFGILNLAILNLPGSLLRLTPLRQKSDEAFAQSGDKALKQKSERTMKGPALVSFKPFGSVRQLPD
jgi:hypothetical protein